MTKVKELINKIDKEKQQAKEHKVKLFLNNIENDIETLQDRENEFYKKYKQYKEAWLKLSEILTELEDKDIEYVLETKEDIKNKVKHILI